MWYAFPFSPTDLLQSPATTIRCSDRNKWWSSVRRKTTAVLLGTSDEWIGTWIMGTVGKEELEARRAQAMDDFAHFMRTGEWTME
ncbi:MAG: hypothetical protein ACI30J_01185 [Paludibacteraceae bacterium]